MKPGLTLWIWHPLGRLLLPASRNGRIATWPPPALDRRWLATSRSLGLAESQLALKSKPIHRMKLLLNEFHKSQIETG